MHKLFIFGATSTPNTVKSLTLRQGLNPTLDNDFSVVASIGSGGSHNNKADISPDKTKIVLTSSASNIAHNMLYKEILLSDESELFFNNMETHSVSFSGIVNCCSTSNDFRAYAGSMPYLYVFSWASNNLVTISTTGLGNVIAVKFSPDGNYLAVGHSTAPYLRIYNTSDWSHVNGQLLNAQVRGIEWLEDSSAFVAIVFTPGVDALKLISNAGVALYSSKASGVENVYFPNSIKLIKGSKDFIICTQSADTTRRLLKFNADTFAITSVMDIQTIGTITLKQLEIDPVDMVVYINHSFYSARYMSKVNLIGTPVFEKIGGLIDHVVGTDTVSLLTVTRNTGKVTGTVRDIDNLPAARTVLAYDRATGDLVGKTVSDASTGDYVLNLPSYGDHDIVFRIQDGEQLNDLFFARVEPEAV